MNINIELSNIKKHFLSLSNNHENDENNELKTKYKTKIINQCFNSINEVNISDKIKDNIPYYSNNYSIIEDYDYINISQLNGKYIDKITLMNNTKYLIFSYKNEKYVTFNDFLFSLTNPKLFIFNVIESFSYILKSLIKLNENNICFFNLSPKNIFFNLDCGEKPILRNFKLSLQISNLNESYIRNIINNVEDYTYKPLEVHVLFYLIKNDLNTISYSFIEEICQIYVKNLSVLNFFSEKYKEAYKNSSIEILKKYFKSKQ